MEATSMHQEASGYKFLAPQAERLLLYYEIVHGFDDSVFYFSEKESIELKIRAREIHLQIRAFAVDPGQRVLSFPPLHPQLRAQVYLSSKKLDLFWHGEGEGEQKA